MKFAQLTVVFATTGCFPGAWSWDAGSGDARAGSESVSPTSDAPDAYTAVSSCGDGLGHCNPINQSGCEQVQLPCLFYTGMTTSCTARGHLGWGSPCIMSMPQDCLPGFVCAEDSNRVPRCAKLCCPGDDRACRDTATGGRDDISSVCGPPIVGTGSLSACAPL